jgi:hypothetical protein
MHLLVGIIASRRTGYSTKTTLTVAPANAAATVSAIVISGKAIAAAVAAPQRAPPASAE